jgi:hypothetical protein
MPGVTAPPATPSSINGTLGHSARPANVVDLTSLASGTMPVIQRIGEDETAMFTTPRHDRRVRPQAGLLLESLDDRLLLSGGASGAASQAGMHAQPANHARLDHQNVIPRELPEDGTPVALPANLSAALRSLYREYVGHGGDNAFTPGLTGDGLLSIRGSRVAVRIKVAFPPALGAYLRDLRADGLQITRTIPAYGLAEGMLPVAKLPAVAQLAAHVWPATPAITR